MIPLSLEQVARAVSGRLADAGDGSALVTAPPFVDTRSPERGGLFVAIAGEHVDGHDFTAAALDGGAVGVLGARPTGTPTVLVDDPVGALGRLARHVLDQLRPTVLALTGSQGKTGTKDYLAQLLALGGPTIATQGNRNNQIGVPLTVLRADPETRFLAVEMGARGLGHVAELCEIAPPAVAAVLNVGTAHIGEFGSREAIARAKSEIVEALPRGGTAVLNADDSLVAAMADRISADVVTFGVAGDVRWRAVELDELGRPSFELGHDDTWVSIRLLEAGAHQVPNATAAAAMAAAVGIDWDEIGSALERARSLSPWRMAMHARSDGVVVVNDAYNANPASMVAALDTLAAIGRSGRRRTVAVLGEMLELGESSSDDHASVGRHAAGLGIDVLVTVGEPAEAIGTGARRTPGWAGEAVSTAGLDHAVAWLRHNVVARDVVLVKASRGAALELVADALLVDGVGAGDGAVEDEEGGNPSR